MNLMTYNARDLDLDTMSKLNLSGLGFLSDLVDKESKSFYGEGVLVLAMNDDGVVIGGIVATKRRNFVVMQGVQVNKDYRRQGVGLKLANEVLRVTDAKKVIGIGKNSEEAYKFWQSFGRQFGQETTFPNELERSNPWKNEFPFSFKIN